MLSGGADGCFFGAARVGGGQHGYTYHSQALSLGAGAVGA